MPDLFAPLRSCLARVCAPLLLHFGTVLRRGVTVACVLAPCLSAAAGPRCAPAAQTQTLHPLLPGISLLQGQWPARDQLGTPHRATTVVLGEGRSVTVIDPGPTRAWGLQLKQQLLCQRRQRVVQVINSHAHAEHVLANSAFAVPVLATAGTLAAMRQRCPACLAALRQDLGATALRGTRIVLPGQTLREGQPLHAGGRVWQTLDMQNAHTESDLVLWSPAERIALVGPLIDDTGLVLAQGSVQGWLQALERIESLQPQWLIGQHGVTGTEQVQTALASQRKALCDLVRQAWQGLEKGWSDTEVLQQSGMSSPTAAQRQQARNLLRTWREMEVLWMARAAMPEPCSTPDIGG